MSVTLLEPDGAIGRAGGQLALRFLIDQAIAAGARDLLIDFRRTSRLDSSHVRELIAARARLEAAGGSLRLVHLPSSIRVVLEITRLDDELEILADRPEAPPPTRPTP